MPCPSASARPRSGPSRRARSAIASAHAQSLATTVTEARRAAHRFARGRVDLVRIAAPVLLEVDAVVARGGHRRARPAARRGAPAAAPRPGARCRCATACPRRCGRGRALRRRPRPCSRSCPARRARARRVDAVALGDAGEVGAHAGAPWSQRARVRGRPRSARQSMRALQRARALGRPGSRRAGRAEAPGVDRRRDGDVERAAGGLADLACAARTLPASRATPRTAAVERVPVEARQLRRRRGSVDMRATTPSSAAATAAPRRPRARASTRGAGDLRVLAACPSSGRPVRPRAHRAATHGTRRSRRGARWRPAPAAGCGGGGEEGVHRHAPAIRSVGARRHHGAAPSSRRTAASNRPSPWRISW